MSGACWQRLGRATGARRAPRRDARARLAAARATLADDAANGAAARVALATVLRAALTRPALLTHAALAALVRHLHPRPGGDDLREPALAVLTAFAYARPDLVIRVPVVDRLRAVLHAGVLPEPLAAAAAVVLRALLFTACAPDIAALLRDGLARRDFAEPVCDRLVPVLRDIAQWRPELLDGGDVLALAEGPWLREHRDFLLGHVLERYAFVVPQRFDAATVDRVARVFAGCPRLKYFLAYLGDRPGTPAPARAHIDRLLAGRFPLRAAAGPILRRDGLKLLVVHNVKIGQGDDTARLVPLLQALLDANPTLRVTLVAKRTYLYDNPRVTTVSILDGDAARAALGRRFDGIVHIHEPAVPEVNWRPEVSAAVETYVRDRRPDLVVAGDVGHNHFVFQTVTLAGRSVAGEYAFDRLLLDNIYETTLRLLIELGLPARAGGEPPSSASVLVGEPSADADAVWDSLVVGARAGGAPRPVALVNPFGGAKATKGFVAQQAPLLAAGLAGLVREGFFVVLLPNGTPWVDRGLIDRVLALLAAEIRGCIAVAPDPAEPNPDARRTLTERPELSYADQVMRLFKYFAVKADLIVTVEGWLVHLAYNLGRPFRIFLAPQSHGYDWYPHGRGPDQRLATALSPASAAGGAELLGPDDPPPLPHRPRKDMLCDVLPALGRFGGPEAVPLLLRAATSPDWDVRASAVAALGLVARVGTVKGDLIAALSDGEPAVRGAAVTALLGRGVDCHRELGPRYRDLLRAHRATVHQDWAEVVRLGAVALPALFTAAESDNDVIRREARWILARLLPTHLRLPSRTGRGT